MSNSRKVQSAAEIRIKQKILLDYAAEALFYATNRAVSEATKRDALKKAKEARLGADVCTRMLKASNAGAPNSATAKFSTSRHEAPKKDTHSFDRGIQSVLKNAEGYDFCEEPDFPSVAPGECFAGQCSRRVVAFGYCQRHSDNIKLHGHPHGLKARQPMPRSMRHIKLSVQPLLNYIEYQGSIGKAVSKELNATETNAMNRRISRSIHRGYVTAESADVIAIKGFKVQPEAIWGDEWRHMDDTYRAPIQRKAS